MITVGPVGKLIHGDVLDVNKKALQERLQDFDHQLYLIWNADKLKGHGCWELRRRPNEKTALHVADYEGASFYELDYLESGNNHVKDFSYLNYGILEWVKTHDMWGRFNYQTGKHENTTSFINRTESAELAKMAADKAATRAQTKYEIMQDRSLIRSYRNHINSGTNPAEIARYWK